MISTQNKYFIENESFLLEENGAIMVICMTLIADDVKP